MENISNNNTVDDFSNEKDDTEAENETEKNQNLETESTEEIVADDEILTTDITNQDYTNNTNSETNRSDNNVLHTNTNIDQSPIVDTTEGNTEETVTEDPELKQNEDIVETSNKNDSSEAAEVIESESELKELPSDNVEENLEILNTTSQHFIGSLLNEIIDKVYESCEKVKDTIDNTDLELKEYHEFERIEEVNEQEEHPEEYIKYEKGEHEVMDLNAEEPENIEYNDEEEEEEEEEDVMDTGPKITREQLILELKNAESEKIALFEKNTAYQHKLGEYLRRKKVEQPAAPTIDTKDLTDFDQKYGKLMETLRDLVEKYENDSEKFKEEIEELKSKTLYNEDEVKQEKEKFKNYRFSVAQKSVNTRTGKSISQKEMEDLNEMEEKKESVVVEIRLESIKLQNEVNKNDSILKSKEELADGLHLIDFEQFKIENQSYNEKLEERTEDLLKLRKKITSNVHVLTHVKEKLEFVRGECEIEAKTLEIIDNKLNECRDYLTGLKQARDKLRISNDKMKRSSGMLGNRDLLRNYEDCIDTVEVQVQKMNGMKNKQLQLSLRNQALQMKIENTRKDGST